MKSLAAKLLICVATVFSTTLIASKSSLAAVRSQIQSEAISYLESGNARAAYDLLRKQSKTSPQDWFLYGMAAKSAGNLFETRNAMQQVIRLDPSRSQRAKLELAETQYALEKPVDARQLLNEVKAENPPQLVRQNIDRFLAIIGDNNCHTEGKQRWCSSVTAGVGYDSNVNNATTSDTVVMFGLPFTLSEDAKAQSDTYYNLSAAFDHIAILNDTTAWQSNFTIQWMDYSTLDRFDSLNVSASTGAVFQLDSDTRISVPITANAVFYTDEGELYSSSIGLAPQLRKKLNETVSFNLNTNISRKHFNGDGDRDTTSYSFAPSLDFSACENGTLRIGVQFGKDNSGIDLYSNRSRGINSSLYCSLTPELAMNLYGSYVSSDYDAREIFYTETRNDSRSTVGASIHSSDRGSGLTGSLGVTYISNESNLTLYEYDKFQFSASVKRKF